MLRIVRRGNKRERRSGLAPPLAHGCRMRIDIALNAGTYLALEIAVTQKPTPLTVEVSMVRWCKDGHFGLEFLRYSQGDRERVTDLVGALPTTEISPHPDFTISTLSAVGS
jgi:hypothetical protein